ncbi:MAG: YggS family pyridoxal phosphate-dependent enzyme [Alphaproteobacteria bacterium]
MSVSEKLKSLRAEIKQIAIENARAFSDIHLVAVSKKQPDSRLEEALAAGQRIFGENRVQEAYAHWEERKKLYSDLELHLIGPLQTNKVKEAVALFDVIQSVDREKLARKLAAEMDNQGKSLPCFIQVNTGEEEQKSGIYPAQLQDFYEFCTKECGLSITGLMCIPPLDDPPAAHFALLHKYARGLDLPHLSMGMSADYEQAIALGATYIRIGTGVFGERQTL